MDRNSATKDCLGLKACCGPNLSRLEPGLVLWLPYDLPKLVEATKTGDAARSHIKQSANTKGSGHSEPPPKATSRGLPRAVCCVRVAYNALLTTKGYTRSG